MKGIALNLTRSPEKHIVWERADPMSVGAGQAVGAQKTSATRHPGVSDGIELDNGKEVTRRAANHKALGIANPEYGYAL